MDVLLTAWHLGALHAHEQVLTVLLAFGPFVLLAVVVVVRRRQDAALDAREAHEAAAPGSDAEQAAQRDR